MSADFVLRTAEPMATNAGDSTPFGKLGMNVFSSSLLAGVFFAGIASATVVSVSALHAHNNKNNYGGNLNDLITGEEMDKSGGADDPSQWQLTTSAYQASWQADKRLDSTASDNSKIGWATLDFGSTTPNLDKLYIWNLRDTSAVRAVETYNIYYAAGTVAAFPATPTDSSVVDYAFTPANGWTLFNGSVLTLPDPSGTDAEAVIDLGGISARYLAIEILSANGGTTTDRVGLNEVAVTAIPEPASILLGAMGALTLFRRRR